MLGRLIEPVYAEIALAVRSAPVADIGCADGDLAALLVSFGAEVDAIDHRESNFNQMRGVELQVDWCVVSTRIAQRTPSNTTIESEPLVYLLGSREANNDATNFWVFSATGFLRLLDRTGWIVVNEARTGCTQHSDLVHKEADERIFVLIKSKRLQPGFYVRAVSGVYPWESANWCWTSNQFQLEVVFTDGQQANEFALRMVIPESILPVAVNCQINGIPVGTLNSHYVETTEFRGQFPTNVQSPLRLDFTVESGYQPTGNDQRELGVILPLIDLLDRNTNRIPFRIS